MENILMKKKRRKNGKHFNEKKKRRKNEKHFNEKKRIKNGNLNYIDVT